MTVCEVFDRSDLLKLLSRKDSIAQGSTQSLSTMTSLLFTRYLLPLCLLNTLSNMEKKKTGRRVAKAKIRSERVSCKHYCLHKLEKLLFGAKPTSILLFP